MLLGIFVVINGFLMVIAGISTMTDSFILGLISLILTVGPVYCAWRFLQWFRNKDSTVTRGRLPMAYLIQFVFYAIGVVLAFIGDSTNIGDLIEVGI